MKDTISIRGERELWLEFIHKAKKEKKTEIKTPELDISSIVGKG